ncbi:MAG: hypothetical protein JWM11_3117 [Planctomycetaceae bacterium]|nr:hypothetical protein [Planctomycetaceae bacterium]
MMELWASGNGIDSALVFCRRLDLGSGATGYASAALDFTESNDTGKASGTPIFDFDEALTWGLLVISPFGTGSGLLLAEPSN